GGRGRLRGARAAPAAGAQGGAAEVARAAVRRARRRRTAGLLELRPRHRRGGPRRARRQSLSGLRREAAVRALIVAAPDERLDAPAILEVQARESPTEAGRPPVAARVASDNPDRDVDRRAVFLGVTGHLLVDRQREREAGAGLQIDVLRK